MRQLLQADAAVCEADAQDDPFRYGWRYVRRQSLLRSQVLQGLEEKEPVAKARRLSRRDLPD